MNKTLRDLLLISGIIPATFSFGSWVWGLTPVLVDFFQKRTIKFELVLLLCYCILGLAGYFGLLRNLIFGRNRKVSDSALLIAGILGSPGWIPTIEKPLYIFIFLWPIIVALIVLIDNIFSKESGFKPGILEVQS